MTQLPPQFATTFRVLMCCAAPLFTLGSAAAAPVPDIAPAINSLGLDLYREQAKSAGDSSLLLSPYSLATALAMNLNVGATHLVLLCPAWRKFGAAKKVGPSTILLHSRSDDVVRL